MTMNLVEKGFAIGSITLSVAFMGYMYFQQPKVKKHDAFKVRQQLLKSDDVKMLYSTMSFLYLQGFKSKNVESFYKLYQIMEIQKPQIVALPISKQDYNQKYLKVMSNPKFRQAMDSFLFLLKTRNTQEIQKMTAFDLKNLERLMLIDYCIKLRKCRVVPCRKKTEVYERIDQSTKVLKHQQNIQSSDSNTAKIQDYTDILVAELKPSVKFSLMPQSPFKTIIGLVQPQIMRGVAQKWKQKFKQNYSHTIIQDQQVLQREKLLREVQGKAVD